MLLCKRGTQYSSFFLFSVNCRKNMPLRNKCIRACSAFAHLPPYATHTPQADLHHHVRVARSRGFTRVAGVDEAVCLLLERCC